MYDVSAKDKQSGKEQKIRIQSSGGLSDDEIEQMVKDAEANAEEDRKLKERSEARNHADSALYDTEKNLKEHGDKISEEAKKSVDDQMASLRAMLENTSGIRRAGAAALDLAYVAAGRFDGFWEFGLNIWDIAAGVLLIQEAGGLVSDMDGGHDFLESGNLVAANNKLFKTFLTTLNTASNSV